MGITRNSSQSPTGYSNQNLQGTQLAARIGGTQMSATLAAAVSSTVRGNIRTAIQDAGWAYSIHPLETAFGFVESQLTFGYDPGDSRRYGMVWDGVTDDTVALNRATAICAYAKFELLLPGQTALITDTWNMSTCYGIAQNVNNGLSVRGCGRARTNIKYVAGANNTGIAWDTSSLAFGRLTGFTFIGGSTTANCPQVTLYQGATNTGFSLNTLVGGAGYVNGCYPNVPMTGGTGTRMFCRIVVAGGVVTACTPSAQGSGYLVNDVVSASNANLGGAGAGFSIKVATVNNGTILRSLNNFYDDVEIQAYGDVLAYNCGAEQIDYFNCAGIAWRNNTFGSAQPYVFVASGSNPTISSNLQTTFTPCQSMTVVHWYGARAINVFNGSLGIVFHFTGTNAGACADIRFDDWFQVLTPAGAFKFMTDDSSGAAGTGLFNCGGERMTMEVGVANANMNVCTFAVALPKGIKFEGHGGSGGTGISARPFEFAATSVPTDCVFDWDPNESASWTGDYILHGSGSEGGCTVRAPVPSGNLYSFTTARTIDGFLGFGVEGQGTDYAITTGMMKAQGPGVDNQFNRLAKFRSGAFVSANSDANIGVQTTQNVANVATAICNLPNFANLVIITGANGGGDKFCDLIFCSFVGATVLSSLTQSGAPATRTYTFAANVLKLTMGSATTINVECTVLGGGMQA